jgi:hypothetical protein
MIRLGLRIAPLLALALAACSEGQFKQVHPILTISSQEPIDFGNNPVLQKISRTVEVGNVGKAPLALTMKIVPGTAAPLDGSSGNGADGGMDDAGSADPIDPNVFTFEAKEGPLPLELASSGSVTLVISFLATKEGSYTGTFVIDSDDSETPHIEIPLTARANTSARIEVQPTDCLDFGRVGESRSLVREATVTSVGTAPLTLGQLEIEGPAADSFAVMGSRAGGTLEVTQPPASVNIGIKYAPNPAHADMNGDLTANLVLSTNDPFNRTVKVCLKGKVNRQPIADGKVVEPHVGQTLVAPNTRVGLDASTSTDPDGDLPLSYKWTLTPASGSSATLDNTTTPLTHFTPEFPGVYTAQLTVTDSAGLASKTQRITINVASDNRVRVELIWNHPVADLDLHMRPAGKQLNSVSDCYGYNQSPTDWGSEDPPYHYGDKLSGFGPEIIDYVDPADGQYQITVVYSSAQGAANTAMTATVRVYQFGVVRSELSKQLSTPGEQWNVGVFSWPSGLVTPGTGSP